MRPTRPPSPVMTTHSISLTTAYGHVLASEQVPEPDFPAALRRFYNRAMQRMNSIVVIDGVAHTRNAFLDFVREFNEHATHAARLERCGDGRAAEPPRAGSPRERSTAWPAGHLAPSGGGAPPRAGR